MNATPSDQGENRFPTDKYDEKDTSQTKTPAQPSSTLASADARDAEKDHRATPNLDSLSSDSSNASNLKPTARDIGTPHATDEPSTDPQEDLSRPPPLNYTLRTRKLAITIFWFFILLDSIGIPLILYFCLHYLTNLSPNAVFSISTGCLGGISIFEYFLRFWRLWRKGSTCRVIGARRWYLDWFHWNFSIGWIFIMFELIIGTVFDHPPIRVLAMPVASLLFWFAFELLVIDTYRFLKIPAPMRISSVPKGAPMRPAIYSIIEDVCAVDGSGGTEFRERLNKRYLASHYFRQMLHRLTLFWAVGSLLNATVTTGLVFGLHNNEIAYIMGWALPFVWSGIMIPPTFWYSIGGEETPKDLANKPPVSTSLNLRVGSVQVLVYESQHPEEFIDAPTATFHAASFKAYKTFPLETELLLHD
ncbi:MAG: hypothetical protein Q9162_002226 [Coniocarpon cinnabarinum]